MQYTCLEESSTTTEDDSDFRLVDDCRLALQAKDCTEYQHIQSCLGCIKIESMERDDESSVDAGFCRFKNARAYPIAGLHEGTVNIRCKSLGLAIGEGGGPVWYGDESLEVRPEIASTWSFNRYMEDEVCDSKLNALATTFLERLITDVKHLDSPKAQWMPIVDKLVCDSCLTSICFSSFRCGICGGEYCLYCVDDLIKGKVIEGEDSISHCLQEDGVAREERCDVMVDDCEVSVSM